MPCYRYRNPPLTLPCHHHHSLKQRSRQQLPPLATFEPLPFALRLDLVLAAQLGVDAVRRAPSLLDRLRLLVQLLGVGFQFDGGLCLHRCRCGLNLPLHLVLVGFGSPNP